MEGDNIGLIYFYGTHCPTCKITLPIINRIAKKHTVVIVNIEEYPKMTADYGIMSIPTLIVLKNDTITDYFIGTRISKVEERWNELMSL